MADRRLVALERAARRPLAAPAELLEQPPDVAGMILHPARLLDEDRDAPRGPQARVEAERLGSAFEPLLDAPEVGGAELRLATGAPCFLQPGTAGDHELPRPPIHRLPMDVELSGDFRLAHPLLEERGRFEPPSFERIEIPPHPHRIPNAARIAQSDALVTILREIQ